MRVPVLLLLLLAGAASAHAQYRGPYGTTYLFATGPRDARALWVNPAGLGTLSESSLMGEVVLDRFVDGGLGLGQYTAGFNSRGLAFGFRHDRLSDTLSGNAFRVGGGRTLGRLAVGLSLTFYTNGDFPTQRDVELGVRYLLTRRIEVAAVAEHILKPTVFDSLLTLAARAGVAWRPLPGVRLMAEAHAADRTVGTGVLNRWRAGLQIGAGGRLPVSVLGVLDLADDFEPARLTVGLRVGGERAGVLSGSDVLRDGTIRASSVALTGIAVNQLDRR